MLGQVAGASGPVADPVILKWSIAMVACAYITVKAARVGQRIRRAEEQFQQLEESTNRFRTESKDKPISELLRKLASGYDGNHPTLMLKDSISDILATGGETSSAYRAVDRIRSKSYVQIDELRSQANAPVYLGLAGTLVALIFAVITYNQSSATAVTDLVQAFAPTFLASLIGVLCTLGLGYTRIPKLDLRTEEALQAVDRLLTITLLPIIAAEPNNPTAIAISAALRPVHHELERATDTLKAAVVKVNDSLEKMDSAVDALQAAALDAKDSFKDLRAGMVGIGNLAKEAPALTGHIGNIAKVTQELVPAVQRSEQVIANLNRQQDQLDALASALVTVSSAVQKVSSVADGMETLPAVAQGSVDRLGMMLSERVSELLQSLKEADDTRDTHFKQLSELLDVHARQLQFMLNQSGSQVVAAAEARAMDEVRRQLDVLLEALKSFGEARRSEMAPVDLTPLAQRIDKALQGIEELRRRPTVSPAPISAGVPTVGSVKPVPKPDKPNFFDNIWKVFGIRK